MHDGNNGNGAATTDLESIPRAVLGMPGYGTLTGGAARGFWRATRGPVAKRPVRLAVNYQNGSLLAQNFNALWCTALNDVKHGRRVDYFAMLHSDIEPEEFWLDKLIDELEEKQLDVLGAVVPIKDPNGLTSLALEQDEPDNWRPLCRLTMREVFKLPETFTSADAGHTLLLNTGCWVCRFDHEWASQVHFTINDRIVWNEPQGIYQAQVEPEDWFFSRLCHELKLRIGATRKVRLEHVGRMPFVNYEPWGDQEFDAAYIDRSPLPETIGAADASGFRFPNDVDGWLSYDEGRALAKLAEGKDVLEIGSYCGRSTICMAQTAKRVLAVDPFDTRGTPRTKRSTVREFDANVERYGLSDRIMRLIGTADDVLSNGMLDREFDLAFIDGAHDVDSVRNDISHARRLLKPDGLLAFHDYRVHPGQYDGRWDPGVTTAVGELIAEGGEVLSVHSTVAVVRPPQPQRLEV